MHNTNRKTNLVKVGLGDQVSPPTPSFTPQLFTVDLADSVAKWPRPAQISDS